MTRDMIAQRFGTTGYDAIAKQAYDLLKRVDARFQGRTWPTERAELGKEASAKVLFRLSSLKYVKIKGGTALFWDRERHAPSTRGAFGGTRAP